MYQDFIYIRLKHCSSRSPLASNNHRVHPPTLSTAQLNPRLDSSGTLRLLRGFFFPSGLRVQIVVSVDNPVSHDLQNEFDVYVYVFFLPFRSPLHGPVSDQYRRQPVQDLVPRPSEHVEDGGVKRAGQRSLSVRRERVRRHVPLGLGAYFSRGKKTSVSLSSFLAYFVLFSSVSFSFHQRNGIEKFPGLTLLERWEKRANQRVLSYLDHPSLRYNCGQREC